MRTCWRVTLVVGLTVGMAVAATAPAGADDGAGAYVPPGGSPTAVVEETGAPGGGADGEGGDSECWWEVQIPDDQLQPVYEVDGTRLYSSTGRWLQKLCRGGELVDQQPEGGLVDIDALAREAAESVSISGPRLRTSPSAGDLLYVHVPTWLWISDTWWKGYSATATTGRVSATVTATPVSVSWSTGDGSTVSCAGPGTAWTAGSADSESGCQYTYRRATDPAEGKSLALSATVTLEVTWTSSIGIGGTLDPISRTATVQVAVAEIQAIETE